MLCAVVRKEGRHYVAWTPELDIASQGKSPEAAVEALKEAVELYLEDADALPPLGTPMIATFEVHHDPKAPGTVGA